MLEENPFFKKNLKPLKFFGVLLEYGYVKYFLLISSGTMNFSQWYYLLDHYDQVLVEDVLMAIGLFYYHIRSFSVVFNPKGLENLMWDVDELYHELINVEEYNEGEFAIELFKEAVLRVNWISRFIIWAIYLAIFGKYIPEYIFTGRCLYVRVSLPFIDGTKVPFAGFFFVVEATFPILTYFISLPLLNISIGCIIFIQSSYKVLAYRIEKSLETAGLKEIARIIKLHCRLIQLTRHLEEIITYSVFLEMVSFGGATCFGLSNTNQAEMLFSRFVMMVYSLICLAFLFCPCWLANFISEEHDKISEVAYGISWYNSTAEVKRTVFFLVMRSRIPLEMRAARLYPMSLEMYSGFIKICYTYINIIHNVFN